MKNNGRQLCITTIHTHAPRTKHPLQEHEQEHTRNVNKDDAAEEEKSLHLIPRCEIEDAAHKVEPLCVAHVWMQDRERTQYSFQRLQHLRSVRKPFVLGKRARDIKADLLQRVWVHLASPAAEGASAFLNRYVHALLCWLPPIVLLNHTLRRKRPHFVAQMVRDALANEALD